MKVLIELTEKDLRRLAVAEIARRTGQTVDEKHVHTETKSTQNYKSEWESALFRARYESDEEVSP